MRFALIVRFSFPESADPYSDFSGMDLHPTPVAANGRGENHGRPCGRSTREIRFGEKSPRV